MHSWWRAKYLPRAANIRNVFFKLNKELKFAFSQVPPSGSSLALHCNTKQEYILSSWWLFSKVPIQLSCLSWAISSQSPSTIPWITRILNSFPTWSSSSERAHLSMSLFHISNLKKKKSIPINGYSNWDFKPSFCCINSQGVLEKHILTTWFR